MSTARELNDTSVPTIIANKMRTPKVGSMSHRNYQIMPSSGVAGCVEIKFYGAFVLKCRLLTQTPAR